MKIDSEFVWGAFTFMMLNMAVIVCGTLILFGGIYLTLKVGGWFSRQWKKYFEKSE